MISVTDARLIFFQWTKTKPIATSRKTGINGDKGLKISTERRKFSVALQGCEENEAQGFTQLDDRSKVVRIDAVISPSEVASAKQSKKRQI